MSEGDDKSQKDQLEVFHEFMGRSSEDESACGFSVSRYCRMSARASTLQTFSVDMENVLEEIGESGDGGNSDVEGEVCEDLDCAFEEAEADRTMHKYDNDIAAFTD